VRSVVVEARAGSWKRQHRLHSHPRAVLPDVNGRAQGFTHNVGRLHIHKRAWGKRYDGMGGGGAGADRPASAPGTPQLPQGDGSGPPATHGPSRSGGQRPLRVAHAHAHQPAHTTSGCRRWTERRQQRCVRSKPASPWVRLEVPWGWCLPAQTPKERCNPRRGHNQVSTPHY
jgi:hypothetical protein